MKMAAAPLYAVRISRRDVPASAKATFAPLRSLASRTRKYPTEILSLVTRCDSIGGVVY